MTVSGSANDPDPIWLRASRGEVLPLVRYWQGLALFVEGLQVVFVDQMLCPDLLGAQFPRPDPSTDGSGFRPSLFAASGTVSHLILNDWREISGGSSASDFRVTF